MLAAMRLDFTDRSRGLRGACVACGAAADFCAASAAPDIELGRYLSRRMRHLPSRRDARRARSRTSTGIAEQTFVEVVKAYRDKQLAQCGDAEHRRPPQGRGDRGACGLFRQNQATMTNATRRSMTDLTRRRFTALAGRLRIAHAAVRARRARPGQAEARRDRRRAGRRHGRALRQQGPARRDRRHADRAAEELHHLLLLEHLCRRLPRRSSRSPTATTRCARRASSVVHEAAASIDRDKKQVVLAGGKRIPYDRLVVAPGIDIKFDSVPGYSEAAAAGHAACLEARARRPSCWSRSSTR